MLDEHANADTLVTAVKRCIDEAIKPHTEKAAAKVSVTLGPLGAWKIHVLFPMGSKADEPPHPVCVWRLPGEPAEVVRLARGRNLNRADLRVVREMEDGLLAIADDLDWIVAEASR